MKTDRQKGAAPGKKQLDEERPGPEAAGRGDEESCRCKEASRKSFPELLKVVISDLSFWKKGK
jgi:hypothetical protein